jgi:(p)ppGpp synthase/HD superfamily hydrolase
MPSLENAIQLAIRAHKGQKDKAGAPYIFHPLRVMLRMESETEKIIVFLHDVIEDSKFTIQDLRDAGYSEEILEVIDYLTRRDGEEYDLFIERIKGNPLARKVKTADLEDNVDMGRIRDPNEKDVNRVKKYQEALAELRKVK